MKDRMRYPGVTALAVILPLTFLGSTRAAAQQPTGPAPVQAARPLALPTLRPPVADTGTFSPISFPPGNDIRQADGAPGRAYWQQRVDYLIRATLDTAAKRLSGTESIRYANNSPDTLRFVWMQLDQNLFRPGSTGSLLFASESRFGGAGFAGGFDVSTVMQCGELVATVASKRTPRGTAGARRKASKRSASPAESASLPRCPSAPLKTRVDDTMMYVDLATPIPPGGATVFEISYGFNIPEHGADRMGRDGSLYEIAQWYPRMAVYDDVHGWNTDQYLGQGEFYLEYGDIAYEVTVPAGLSWPAPASCRTPLMSSPLPSVNGWLRH
jgi:hypothetical protein